MALSGAISSHRVGHAYLFTGARGVGKTSAARILAKALNCEHGPTPTPCNECDICRSIARGDDVDVLEIDGASNRGIDEIRQLRQNVNIRPSRARFKIYIIDEVHMLTREAFNALLKTLEEPPEHVKFIFCTTEPEKIPITILSRCQRFDFAGIQADVDRRAAAANRRRPKGSRPSDEALALLARRAAGSMRDSQSLLEQLLGARRKADHGRRRACDARHGRRSAARSAWSRTWSSTTRPAALADLDAALAEGVDVGQLLDQLLGYFRDVDGGGGRLLDRKLFCTPIRASTAADRDRGTAVGAGNDSGHDANPRPDAVAIAIQHASPHARRIGAGADREAGRSRTSLSDLIAELRTGVAGRTGRQQMSAMLPRRALWPQKKKLT